MKVCHLPIEIRALIFDMDLTLYTNQEYGEYQIDRLIEKLQVLRGLSFNAMKNEIENKRKIWAESHGGKKGSFSNILAGYGIGMEENIRWRNETCDVEKFIKSDPRLAQTLKELSAFYTLGVVTNNPVLTARRTLTVLGVADFLPIVVGLDTCMTPKPHRKPFEKFSELSGCPEHSCVSIGDRYDIDLDIPLEMGMGGILVDGVEDVYSLGEIFARRI